MMAYIAIMVLMVVGFVVAHAMHRYDRAIDQCEAEYESTIRIIRLYEALNRAAEYEDEPMQEPPIIDTPNLAEGDMT